MPVFLRVIAGGQETTLTVDRIVTINDQIYNPDAHPSESNLSDRMSVVENAVAHLSDGLANLVQWLASNEENPEDTPESQSPEDKGS